MLSKSLTIFSFLFFLCTAQLAHSEEVNNANVVIDSLTVTVSDEFKDTQDNRNLIPFTEGDSTTIDELQKAFESLKSFEWMQSLDYTITPLSDHHIKVSVNMQSYKTVRGVRVKGNYPFLSKKIKRLIPLQPGSPFNENKLGESAQIITEFLKKQGYYDSKVTIEYKNHKKFPVVDLKIKIEKGDIYRFGQIKVEGNEVFGDSRIKNRVSRTARFQETHLRKDLQRINRLYSKKGYIKSRTKVENIDFDATNRVVNLDINIRENKKLVLTFSGSKAVSAAKLKNIAGFDQTRSYDNFAIEQGRNKLLRYFIKNGYANAQIYPTVFKENNIIYVDYEIDAGMRIQLNKLNFEGNKKISDKKLVKALQSKESKLFVPGVFDEALLAKDKATILQIYQDEGFLDAEVMEPEIKSNTFGDQRSVTFVVKENFPYEVSDLEFYGLPDDSLLFTQKLPLRSKRHFNQKRFVQTQEKVLENLYELGYAYAVIMPEVEKHPETASLKVIYRIDAGPKTKVRHIIIKGDHKTRLSMINQNLTFKENDPFNYQKLLNSQLNLRRLGIFSTVNVTALGYESRQQEIDVVFEVLEDRSMTTNFQVGYDNRSSIRGEVNFTKRNLFGLAKQVNTRFIGGLRFNRIENTFIAPRIFGADLNLANQYFAEYEDAEIYDAYSYGSYLSALKTFGARWTLGIKDQVTRTEVVESRSDVAALGNSLFDNTLNEFRLFGYYDARDNFSDPEKGVYVYANNEVSTLLSDLANNFDTIELGLTHHKKLISRLTLNQSLRYGQIFSLTEESLVPFNKLFFMGGSDTVRGFNEDAVNKSGGIVRLLYNAELHYKLANGFKIATFFDAGILEDNVNNITVNDMRESAGFGLRYFTPVGPIRLDYGFILDRRDNEPTSHLHFSFGYFF